MNANERGGNRFGFGPDLLKKDLVTDEIKTTQSVGMGWTQVLSPKTIAQANVDISFVNGYQSNPYYIVRVNGEEFIDSRPDTRTRRAFVGRINQALDRNSFLQGSYRYYNDTWSVDSHTLQVDLSRYFRSKTWLFDFGFRYYTQGKADFYQELYTVPQEFMTNDYRLDAFRANSFLAKVIYAPQFFKTHTFLKNLRVDATYQRYTTTADYSSNLWQLGVQSQF